MKQGEAIEKNVYCNINVTVKKINEESGRASVYETHNITTDVGLNWIRDLFYGDSVSGLTHIGFGTGTTDETPGDTSLENEVHRAQFTKMEKIPQGLEIKYYLSSTTANGNVLGEAALFGNGATNTAGTGDMYARVTFPAESKTNAEAWTITWTLEWVVV